jgi:hypothetical protein
MSPEQGLLSAQHFDTQRQHIQHSEGREHLNLVVDEQLGSGAPALLVAVVEL